MSIEWVFFDVGNVLFNDDPQSFTAYDFYHRALCELDDEYDWERMLQDREALAAQGQTWIIHKIAKKYLSDFAISQLYQSLREHLFPRYDDHHLPWESLTDQLDRLRQRYRLGIIANQPTECRESLKRRGLLDRFDVVAISEELDLHKPDRRLFEWALAQANVDPVKTVMVGDRRDNDIEPAKAVGMQTLWLRWSSHQTKNWRPTDRKAQQFLESCDRVPAFHALANEQNRPDRQIDHFDQVANAVDRWEAS